MVTHLQMLRNLLLQTLDMEILSWVLLNLVEGLLWLFNQVQIPFLTESLVRLGVLGDELVPHTLSAGLLDKVPRLHRVS